MSVYLNERKTLLISLFVILLDGLIIYYTPSYFNNINYFYPMITISFIPFVYFINKNNYYILIIIIGIIYDLLFSNIYLYNVILFIILINLDIKISNFFKNSLLLSIILSIINIIVYDTISFIFIIITNYNQITISDLIYKINHSIILNIMSVFVLWFLLKKSLINT